MINSTRIQNTLIKERRKDKKWAIMIIFRVIGLMQDDADEDHLY